MKYGIYYAYWEQEWRADYLPYIAKAAQLGFDILEIACTPLCDYPEQTLRDLRQAARDHGIELTAGHGPGPEQNLASADPATAAQARKFYFELLRRLEIMDIRTIGGGI